MEKIELSKVIHKSCLWLAQKQQQKRRLSLKLAKMLEEQNFISSAEHFITDVYLRKKKGKQALVKVWQSPWKVSDSKRDNSRNRGFR